MRMEYLLAIPIALWGLVNFAVYKSVQLLSQPDKLLEEVEAIDVEAFLSAHKDFSMWCLENEFVHEKYFFFHGAADTPPINCSAWWSSATKTWALIYVAHTGGKNIDFVTTFKNGIGVTTASYKDALTLPKPPGDYIQALTDISNDERYALHQETVSNIGSKHQSADKIDKGELFQLISESISKQAAYVKKLPFWYLRGAYWYFISRNLNANKKI